MKPDPDFAQDNSEVNIVWVPKQLDDADLTAPQFRVYCHLARRSQNTSWPGIPSIARVCRLSEDTVRQSLKELAGLKMLTATERPGKTRLYTLTKPSEWTNPSRTIPPVNNDTTPVTNNDTTVVRNNGGRRRTNKVTPEGNPDIFGDADGNPVGLKSELPPIPQNLNTEAFTEAWLDWQRLCKERRKPLKPTSAKRQLQTLSAMGPARAVAAVLHSIEKNYQGIYEPTTNGSGTHPKNTRASIHMRQGIYDGVGSVGERQ